MLLLMCVCVCACGSIPCAQHLLVHIEHLGTAHVFSFFEISELNRTCNPIGRICAREPRSADVGSRPSLRLLSQVPTRLKFEKDDIFERTKVLENAAQRKFPWI